jgi:hypothetical protein
MMAGTSLTEFAHRLADWIREQPEVTEELHVFHGTQPGMQPDQEIIGFDIDGVPVSLGMNYTP